MSRLCEEFSTSRKLGYKILKRYRDCGVEGLTGRSRHPYRHANLADRDADRPAEAGEAGLGCAQDRGAAGAALSGCAPAGGRSPGKGQNLIDPFPSKVDPGQPSFSDDRSVG